MTVTTGIDIEAVLFDLDDTLYDRSEAFRRWGAAFVAERLGLLEGAECAAALDWLAAADGNGYCPRPEFARAVLARFPQVDQPVSEFVTAFRIGLVAAIVPDTATDRLLDTLARRAIPFGIVTNGSTEQQTRKIRHLGLAERAACVLISESFGRKKPSPDIFLAAAVQIGQSPERILFVGDHPDLDIAGAQAVGMKTAWVRRGREWPAECTISPDIAIDRLDELAPLVARPAGSAA